MQFMRLRVDSKNSLEIPFSEEEVKGWLDECNEEKALGSNSFKMKFYQVF